MANKMLIDATHPEETRVVVLRGNRVEEFDFESASRRQLRGNIYLAKVTRVEPSLQAAFIDYGGNRHGFLAFSEIHPDYYQIPVADRLALIEEEERAHRAAEAEADRRASARSQQRSLAAAHGSRRGRRVASEPVLDRSPETAAPAPTADRAEFGSPIEDIAQPVDSFMGLEPAPLPGEAASGTPADAAEQAADAPTAPAGPGLIPEPIAAAEAPVAASDFLAAAPAVEPERPQDRIAASPDADGEAAMTERSEAPATRGAEDRPAGGGEDGRVDAEGASEAREANESPERLETDRAVSLRGDFGAAAHDDDGDDDDDDDDDDEDTQNGDRSDESSIDRTGRADDLDDDEEEDDQDEDEVAEGEAEEHVEMVGGADALEEAQERAPRVRRQYKIQEVIKRRQIMLVQVVKEERGTKGAALTTYLSLAGRYSVLMPNTARGGGISRKITSPQDRGRLKEIAQDLEVPEGMGVILRTAGASRNKTEIKRDFEYLLRMWEQVRDFTLRSTAPTLVYEEGSVVKRAIRDLYNKDIDEVIVAGADAYREAKDFMRMLMPSHAKNVRLHAENQPLLSRYGVESQLEAMFSPIVQLRSGGYIVLNQAEALVAIDVNSGRATREHHIEDTALKTNLEAAEEIARQLRLRDLAGLIVIDFIDMDEKRNNRAVERRLKECLKNDRARIQVGRISHFGLLEMSRQRIRTSVFESSTEKCPHCGGAGHVRSVASVALQSLRMLEESLLRGATHNIVVRTGADIALYMLNQKRAHLRDLEQRFRIAVTVKVDGGMTGQQPFAIERAEQVHSLEQARAFLAQPALTAIAPPIAEDDVEEEDFAEFDGEPPPTARDEGRDEAGEDAERADAGENGARRRRRRRRRGRREDRPEAEAATGAAEVLGDDRVDFEDRDGLDEGEEAEGIAGAEGGSPARGAAEAAGGEAGDRRRRRRGRRGGRRNRRPEGEPSGAPALDGDAPELPSFEWAGDEPVAPPTTAEDAREPLETLGALEGIETFELLTPPDRPAAEAEAARPPAYLPDEAVAEVAPRLVEDMAEPGAPAVAPDAAAVEAVAAPATDHAAAPPPFSAEPPPFPAEQGEAAPKLESTPAPQRQRSTVREPFGFSPAGGGGVSAPSAPGLVGGASPAAEPPDADAAEASAEADAEPSATRRTGWWSRRLLGGKKD